MQYNNLFQEYCSTESATKEGEGTVYKGIHCKVVYMAKTFFLIVKKKYYFSEKMKKS